MFMSGESARGRFRLGRVDVSLPIDVRRIGPEMLEVRRRVSPG
jgi:hypothetical protein